MRIRPLSPLTTAVALASLSLAACGLGRSQDPPTGAPAQAARSTGDDAGGATLLPFPGVACLAPAALSTTETSDGCYEADLSFTHNGIPGNLCASNQFGLICQGPSLSESGSPSPDPSLGCSPASGPTPLNVADYCCPCLGAAVGGGEDAGAPGVTCTGTSGGSSSSGGNSCQVQGSEACSDGTNYNVSCICPEATCTCTETSPMSGGSGGGIPFHGCSEDCSSTTVALAYAACGYPHN